MPSLCHLFDISAPVSILVQVSRKFGSSYQTSVLKDSVCKCSWNAVDMPIEC